MKSSVRWSQTAVSFARICQPSSCSGNGAYPSPHTSSPIEWVHNEEIEYRGTFCLGRGWILWRYDFITVLWCYGTPNNVVDRLAQVILPTSYFGICFVVLLALALLGIKLWSGRCVQQYWNAVQCNFSAPSFFSSAHQLSGKPCIVCRPTYDCTLAAHFCRILWGGDE